MQRKTQMIPGATASGVKKLRLAKPVPARRSPLRSIAEDMMCLFLYLNPRLSVDIDSSLLTGVHRDFVEELQFAPHLSAEVGPIWMVAILTEHAEEQWRRRILQFAKSLHKTSRKPLALPPFEKLKSALEELDQLELAAHPVTRGNAA